MELKTIRRVLIPAFLLALLLVPSLYYRDPESIAIQAEYLTGIITALRYLINTAVWIVGGVLVVRLIDLFVWKRMIETKIGQPVPKLLKDVVAIVVLVLAFSGIMATVFNRSLSGVIAASGVAGLVIGFAVQQLIADFFSGIILNINPPFSVGQWIKLDNDEWAKAVETNWRATVFEDFYCNTLTVPNSRVSRMAVRNFETHKTYTAQSMEIYVDSRVPTGRILDILLSAGKEARYAMDPSGELPEPFVGITDLSERGVRYMLYYHIPSVASYISSRTTLYETVVNHLYQAGIDPVPPRYEVGTRAAPEFVSRHRDRAALLRKADLLAGLTDEEIAGLAAQMAEHRFAPGGAVVEQGEAGESMYLLVEGLLSVFIDIEGTEKMVAKLGPGTVFGEMSLLTGERRTATIRADVRSLAYEVTKPVFETVLKERPEVMGPISETMAWRKLRNAESADGANERAIQEQQQSMAGQILSRIKTFFGMS